jgi:Trk K+ transport system NAD-binding subunit
MAIAVINAYILYRILGLILGSSLHTYIKTFLILLVGYLVFVLAAFFREYSAEHTPYELLVEPLLITMIAGFLITNYSKHRTEFHQILSKTGPYVYIAFFTLTGASLKLDILAKVWPIALVLVAVRLIAIMIGSFTGGMLAGDPLSHNKLKWMGFMTQAGVALGLAKEVADQFPSFGTEFATMIIAVVVLNQIIGPIFLKYAINKVGEAHTHGTAAPFDGKRDAIIFGLDNQAMALAPQLRHHNWQVKIACTDERQLPEIPEGTKTDDFVICDYPVFEIGEELFARLQASNADAIVTMLSDEENLHICELFYENFGTATMITRLHDRAYVDRFHELGVLIVDPGTAIVSLMEQFVRSPSAVSLLLGDDDGQDMMEIILADPALDGAYLRDLRLPADTLIMSLHRGRDVIVTHGYTKLKLGDRITVVGSEESLDQVMLLFE